MTAVPADLPADLLAAGTEVPAYLGPTAALVVAAAVIGYLAVRLRVVPIVGFLLAGVVIGPAQLGLVPQVDTVVAAADIGVILLLFTIGLEFSLERLARLRTWIVVGGGLQVVLTSLAVAGIALALDATAAEAVFTGLLVSLSSTAIVLTLLSGRGESGSTRGRISLAVLLFQDLAVVVMVLVVPLLGPESSGGSPALDLAVALAKALGIIAVVLVLARRVMPPLLERVARTCSTEVFLLTVLAICLGTAYLTALAGVSVSLGAFLAGLVVSESRHSTHALGEVLPLKVLFTAVFFVSVGMLLDVSFVLANLGGIVIAVLAVLVVKAVLGATAVVAVRLPFGLAVGTGLLLAQIGEFSFVLEGVGRQSGLTPLGLGSDGVQLFIAVTVLLMMATPALSWAGSRAEAALSGRARRRGSGSGADVPSAGIPELPALGADSDLLTGGSGSGLVVVSGWGPVGRDVADVLRTAGVRVTVVTLNPDGAREAEAEGHRVVIGDSTRQSVLEHAEVPAALLFVVADDEEEQAARIVAAARPLVRGDVVVRVVDEADPGDLAMLGADAVIDAERGALLATVRSVVSGLGRSGPAPHPDPWAPVVLVAPDPGCPHVPARATVMPSSDGCDACRLAGLTWVHLRMCLTCGRVGCCDSSPGRHARAHAEHTGHDVIASAEPGETWVYCFEDGTTTQARPDLQRDSDASRM
ncbi:MAG: cation:proton antiporter [Candidatus Nanopelagicales bacterium]